MSSRRLRLLPTLALLLCAPVFAAGPAFLTGPQSGQPLELALGYLHTHAADYGLAAGDLAELEVTDHYRTQHNGVTHVYLRQRYQGIPVFNGVINLNVARDGSIINLGNSAVSDLAGRIDTVAPSLAPEDAILAAAAHFGIAATEAPLHLETLGGPTLEVRFAPSGISRDEIPASLMFQPLADGSVRLAWRTVIRHPATPDWWDVRVDATTGAVLDQTNWTAHATEGGNCYNVVPLPAADPNDTMMATVTECDPADVTASPFGWHDDDGVAGAEYTITRGNNVYASEDLDANDVPGNSPDGGASLDFLPVWDPGLDPAADPPNLDASIVNLFYYNNIMHDVTYQYGFDEAAGNFQENNYGNGGLESDSVNADALDGSGTNNANFGTPPDGSNPRMQMYRWIAPPAVTITVPGSIAGVYGAGSASFGAAYTSVGVSGDVVYVDDGDDAGGTGTIHDGCEALPGGSLTGKIGMVDRGLCEFGVKALNVQDAGGIAAIVVNNQNLPNGVITMGGGAVGGSVTITAAMLGNADGQLIKDELAIPNTVTLTIAKFAEDRDSDLDNGIIGHEYGHGISNRLIGGPGNVGCFAGDERMGEGLSDFWTVVLSPQASDRASTARGVGTYVIFEERDGLGIRAFPYSIDMAVNPQTFADIAGAVVPHGVGSIWMSMAYEVYQELIARYGLDLDLYQGTGGNNLFIQLIVDGMKLAPCPPTFVSLRDAILQADLVNNAGANQCEIWRGFAKRGLGENASSGTVNLGDEVENFTVPAGCSVLPNYVFDDGFESGDVSRWSASNP